ncbi:YijD family membrane protein [Vibrio salinus]|uniref:YijD family membrane protein n=1 Tax=Vibrio salinus TaxID=2899784 RepID=UPI001E311E2D|nr:YijD family membrane protein [Vibrio salinus]MCE0493520.1 YijD family membrane protein [Vibrio salinus]
MSNEGKNTYRNTELKNLVLALIAGMCCDAILSWLTMAEINFSIFPIIALALSVQSLYQEYLKKPVSEDFPLVGLASFFVGVFGHSAFVKAEYPESGSNFIAIVIVLVLMLWIGKKMGYFSRD